MLFYGLRWKFNYIVSHMNFQGDEINTESNFVKIVEFYVFPISFAPVQVELKKFEIYLPFNK